jgi:hypothetical protein
VYMHHLFCHYPRFVRPHSRSADAATQEAADRLSQF